MYDKEYISRLKFTKYLFSSKIVWLDYTNVRSFPKKKLNIAMQFLKKKETINVTCYWQNISFKLFRQRTLLLFYVFSA